MQRPSDIEQLARDGYFEMREPKNAQGHSTISLAVLKGWKADIEQPGMR
jgi:hypothetical protein